MADAPTDHEADHWALDEPHPTDLIIPWPDEHAPTLTEVQALLASSLDRGIDVIDSFSASDEAMVWNAVVELNENRPPVIVWCEPARDFSAVNVEGEPAPELPWVVGVQTLLDADDPLEHYAWLVRSVCAALADSPGLFDVATGMWFSRSDLNDLFIESPTDPPGEVLWVIHAVGRERSGDETVWLHTHGLNRCVRPELEMIEVPRRYAGPASQLLNDVAELVLENGIPQAAEPTEIGSGLSVAFVPWMEAARYAAAESPGSLADRADPSIEPGHTGVRAAVCAARQKGVFRKVWTWPNEVVNRLATDDAVIYRSRRATERTAGLARATWPEFAMGFATLMSSGLAIDGSSPDAIFLIKAGFAPADVSDPESDREHLWFQVLEVDGDRARAKLVNSPVYVRTMREGDELWVERGRLSDWCVMCKHGRFDPGHRAGMHSAIESLRSSA